ncbi:hypothetical protein ACFOTA_17390 [Chitinophaga sp. GCM10012297]|uniref:Lipocalin-like domain-containing protein n=1 Tax=Chitinophaga chungangae TaxID=2821488 RepID=A0ABS3YH44_9BACT|nr:hypothetical protein [Chitinophaga chungangae]MBO9153996.1 hypothetical protein [Chitinophaga chungangae]
MKITTLSTLLFVLLLSAGCKKDDPPFPSIAGTWEIRESFDVWEHIMYDPGNGNRLVFEKGHYAVYSGGGLSDTGPYLAEDQRPEEAPETRFRLLLNPRIKDREHTLYYEFDEKGRLMLMPDPGFTDGGLVYYEKIK